MPSKQGDLALLNEPVAQELLNGPYTKHLAYVWKDGTPRVIPIGMMWTGTELVAGVFKEAPKMQVIEEGTPVAVTIDTYNFPWHVLMIRGIAHVREYDGLVPEWSQAGEILAGKEVGDQFGGMVGAMFSSGILKSIRLSVEPTWVALLDFQTRFPSTVEYGMAGLGAMSASADEQAAH